MPSFKLRYAKYDSKGCLLWGYRRHLQYHDLAYLTVLEGITISHSKYLQQHWPTFSSQKGGTEVEVNYSLPPLETPLYTNVSSDLVEVELNLCKKMWNVKVPDGT